mmetsp:Transcript_642/g.1428  ORF Transcript_642/g.1428 Transcript_642/m.1428 type:complete len:226 (+) Transcript_642:16-693(+)
MWTSRCSPHLALSPALLIPTSSSSEPVFSVPFFGLAPHVRVHGLLPPLVASAAPLWLQPPDVEALPWRPKCAFWHLLAPALCCLPQLLEQSSSVGALFERCRRPGRSRPLPLPLPLRAPFAPPQALAAGLPQPTRWEAASHPAHSPLSSCCWPPQYHLRLFRRWHQSALLVALMPRLQWEAESNLEFSPHLAQNHHRQLLRSQLLQWCQPEAGPADPLLHPASPS